MNNNVVGREIFYLTFIFQLKIGSNRWGKVPISGSSTSIQWKLVYDLSVIMDYTLVYRHTRCECPVAESARMRPARNNFFQTPFHNLWCESDWLVQHFFSPRSHGNGTRSRLTSKHIVERTYNNRYAYLYINLPRLVRTHWKLVSDRLIRSWSARRALRICSEIFTVKRRKKKKNLTI